MKTFKRQFIEKYIDQSHRVAPELEYEDLEQELLEAIEKDDEIASKAQLAMNQFDQPEDFISPNTPKS